MPKLTIFLLIRRVVLPVLNFWIKLRNRERVDSVTFVNVDVPHDIASDQDGFWSAHISISVD